jgi:hypothetical protein
MNMDNKLENLPEQYFTGWSGVIEYFNYEDNEIEDQYDLEGYILEDDVGCILFLDGMWWYIKDGVVGYGEGWYTDKKSGKSTIHPDAILYKVVDSAYLPSVCKRGGYTAVLCQTYDGVDAIDCHNPGTLLILSDKNMVENMKVKDTLKLWERCRDDEDGWYIPTDIDDPNAGNWD